MKKSIFLLLLISAIFALPIYAQWQGGSGGIGGSTATAVATPVGGYPLTEANGGTGSASLNAALIGQTVNTQGGSPLQTLNGFTWGAETLTNWDYTLPANTMGIYDVQKCHVFGDLQNNTGGAQSVKLTLYFGNRLLSSGLTSLTSSAVYRPWSLDATLSNEGAANVNSIDGYINFGGLANNVGVGAVPTILTGVYSAAAVDTSSNQTVQLGVVVGAATTTVTPSPSPTAGTTPIVHIYGGHCWRLPGMTPTATQTPTATPTLTPTATPT